MALAEDVVEPAATSLHAQVTVNALVLGVLPGGNPSLGDHRPEIGLSWRIGQVRAAGLDADRPVWQGWRLESNNCISVE